MPCPVRSALAPPEELADASVHYHPGATAKGTPLHVPSADTLLDTLDNLPWGHRPRRPHSRSTGGSALDSWRRRSSACGAEKIRPVAADTHGAEGHIASWAHRTSRRRTRWCWDAHWRSVSLQATGGAHGASSRLHGHLPSHHAERRRRGVTTICWIGWEDNHACAGTTATRPSSVLMRHSRRSTWIGVRCHWGVRRR